MTKILQTIFHVYPGEQRNAIVFAFLGFLWAFASTAALKFADALFLLHVGAESLPNVYKITAGGLILLASVLLYAFNNYSIKNIFLSCLGIGFSFYVLVLCCFKANFGMDSDYVWYALRMFGSLFFTLLCTCFWTYIDHYHHLQDAKRLYSLFSSAIFIGVACTGFLMNSGWLNFESLIYIILLVVCATALVVVYISRNLNEVHDDNESLAASHFTQVSLSKQLKSVLTSKFTLLLMTANFLTYLLLVITEFNYMSTFSAHFNLKDIPLEGELVQNTEYTAFFGQWLAIVSISNLFIGLFVYSRLIRRLGVVNLMFITPIILLVSFSGWSISPSLFYPILGLFVVEGTLYVLDDNNFNLLLNAVPAKLKYKIRLCIESFFEPIGMMVSSILLSIEFVDSKTLGLILAGCLMTVAFLMKAQYLKGIYTNLSENAIHFHKRLSDWFSTMGEKEKRNAHACLLNKLKEGKIELVPMILDGIVKTDDSALLLEMLNIVDEMDLEVKKECLRQLLQENHVDPALVIHYFYAWLNNNNDEELKGLIHYYLAIQGWLHPDIARDDIHHPNILLRGAAILSNRNHVDIHLKPLLASEKEEEICMALKIMGLTNSSDINTALSFLDNPSVKIVRSAVEAISLMEASHPEAAKAIVQCLEKSKSSDIRIDCLKALQKIGSASIVSDIIIASDLLKPTEKRFAENVIASFGETAVPVLLKLSENLTLHYNCRILAARALGRLDIKLLRKVVGTIIQNEIKQGFFYLYYKQTIRSENSDISLQLLQQALLAEYQSVVDFVIQILGVAGEIEDCELLTRSLRSPNPKVRSQVVEALEKTCEAKLFRLVYPLVADIPIKTFAKEPYPETIDAFLELLEKSKFYIDQTVAPLYRSYLKLGLLDKLFSKPTQA